MKIKTIIQLGVGIAAPAVLVSTVAGAAPVGGAAAITWALKRIGFGAVKRSFITLGATSAVSSQVAGSCIDAIEQYTNTDSAYTAVE